MQNGNQKRQKEAAKRCKIEEFLNPSIPQSPKSLTYANHINNDEDKRLIVLRERHQLSSKGKKELFNREQAMFRLIKNELQKIRDMEEKINPNVVAIAGPFRSGAVVAPSEVPRSASRACACGRNPGGAGESPPLF
ncbi:MAG: hypothetical protein ACLQVJ_17770 [Syntrophobacteraceae bacterium]